MEEVFPAAREGPAVFASARKGDFASTHEGPSFPVPVKEVFASAPHITPPTTVDVRLDPHFDGERCEEASSRCS